MPAKQTENGPLARTNARKPGNLTNGYTYSYFETSEKSASLVQNIETCLSGFKQNQ